MQLDLYARPRRAARPALAHLGIALLAMSSAPGWSGTWGSEGSFGISSEYNSNPYLVPSGAEAAESGALLFNLPLTYTGDASSLDLIPRLRFSKTHGNVDLLSNYQYLDTLWKLSSDRNTFTAGADIHRDSTFFNQYENAALAGRSLHRLEETGQSDWQRQLSERDDVHLAGSWDHVDYGANAESILENYEYGQLSAQYDRILTERWQWTTTGGAGRYEVIGQGYRSDEEFAQTAVKRALAEQWSVTAQVGYAYLKAQERIFELALGPTGIEVIQAQASGARGAPNFAATLERRHERLTLDLSASRSIQPSGLGALLVQDDLSLKASFDWNERGNVGATVHVSRLSDPLDQLNLGDRRFGNLDLTASWRLTEKWTIQGQASGYLQRVSAQQALGGAFYLTLTRQFGRVQF